MRGWICIFFHHNAATIQPNTWKKISGLNAGRTSLMGADFSLNQMVRQQVRTWDVLDPRVLDVMTRIPRSRFVPLEYLSVAFADFCIPLDHDQVMLAPKVVGRMLQSLNLQPSDRVLELGTGSGYLGACMAALTAHVTSFDPHANFIEKAQQVASDLGLNNISFEQQADYLPQTDRRFDAIVIREPMAQYDDRYEKLLAPGGRLFVNVGEPPVTEARLITREEDGQCLSTSLFETVSARPQNRTSHSFEF